MFPITRTLYTTKTVLVPRFNTYDEVIDINAFVFYYSIPILLYFLYLSFACLSIVLWIFFISKLKKSLINTETILSKTTVKKYKKINNTEACSICLDFF